jgi:hypothetical protein
MADRKQQQKRGAPGPKPMSPEARAIGTYAERYAAGKALREACPRSAHAIWKAPADRPDAVELILRAEKGRVPDLLPLRHGRMVRSAFTFYRGAISTKPFRRPGSGTSSASRQASWWPAGITA